MPVAAQLSLTAIRPGFPAAALMAGAGQIQIQIQMKTRKSKQKYSKYANLNTNAIAAQLPLTAIRPGFPAAALMAGAGQYG